MHVYSMTIVSYHIIPTSDSLRSRSLMELDWTRMALESARNMFLMGSWTFTQCTSSKASSIIPIIV